MGLSEGINTGARVMSLILGFETGLEDGELQDKHTGSADAMYLGVIPKQLDSSVKKHIKEALSYGREFRKAGPMIEKAEHLWVEAKEMVKARAIGLHRLFAEIAKQKKEELASEAGVTLSRREYSKGKTKQQEPGSDKDESEKGDSELDGLVD